MQCSTKEVCKLAIVNKSMWKSAEVDSDTAVSLIAVLSEDPASWDEMIAYWPRYRTPVVVQELSQLQFSEESADLGAMLAMDLSARVEWLFINFDEKRIVTSPSLSISSHDRVFDLFCDTHPDKRWPLSIHLPPWWELVDGAACSTILQARSTSIDVPITNREFLFGNPLIEFIARRILASRHARELLCALPVDANSLSIRPTLALENKRKLHSLTVEIHRDWLMTPRKELNGLIPRQLLHGAHSWIARVTEAQSLRAQEGSRLIAAPVNVFGYANAPMGSEEVVIYFDLCRHLLSCGWNWLSDNAQQLGLASDSKIEQIEPESLQKLVCFLENSRDDFLTTPQEDGCTPSFIIGCSRRRVPRSPELKIEGIDEQQRSKHVLDCECPLCIMLSDGAIGPSFISLEGYHLELDEEFAFSLFETHQQWQEESLFIADESEEVDEENSGDFDLATAASQNAADVMEGNEFTSAWDAIRSPDAFSGDPTGHIKLALMLAEIISYLRSRKAEPNIICRLNDAFQMYRQSDDAALNAAKSALIAELELLAVRYPQLVRRIADFQSYLNQPVQRVPY